MDLPPGWRCALKAAQAGAGLLRVMRVMRGGRSLRTAAPVWQPQQLDAGGFQPEISSFRLHLAAEGKAASTVRT